MQSFSDYWKRSGKVFLSFFTVAAFLPMLLMGTLAPDGFKLLTQADEETPLRLWFEPESSVGKVGQTFKMKLLAEYDDVNKLIPKLKVRVSGGSGLGVGAVEVVYNKPFVGRVVVDELEITPEKLGDWEIEVMESSVDTTLPDLPVFASPAKVSVRQ